MSDDQDYPQTESAKYGDIEVRAPDGVLDEIVGTGTIHLEQLSDGCWWFSFTDKDGHCIHCNLWGTGRQIDDGCDGIDHQVVGRVEYEGQYVPAPKNSGRKWDVVP